MTHSVVWETEGIFRSFSGSVGGDEILESNLKLYKDTRFSSAQFIINDFSEITGVSIDDSQLHAFALTDEMISSERHEFKIALVVPQKDYIDLANNLCELTKDKYFEYSVFQTVDDARKWVANQ